MSKRTHKIAKSKVILGRLLAPALVVFALSAAPDFAWATTTSSDAVSARALQNALSTTDKFSLYGDKKLSGFKISGGLFAGRASGVDSHGFDYRPTEYFDHKIELEHDQRVYALLIDGSYDFNYDFGSGLPLHPYVQGGIGMAMGEGADGVGLSSPAGSLAPLFRVGGGVTYRLDDKWNLSLDYKTGITTAPGSDQYFTGRSQDTVDLHSLNMGMRYKF